MIKFYVVEHEEESRRFFPNRQEAIEHAKLYSGRQVFEIAMYLNKRSVCDLANGKYSQRQVWP